MGGMLKNIKTNALKIQAGFTKNNKDSDDLEKETIALSKMIKDSLNNSKNRAKQILVSINAIQKSNKGKRRSISNGNKLLMKDMRRLRTNYARISNNRRRLSKASIKGLGGYEHLMNSMLSEKEHTMKYDVGKMRKLQTKKASKKSKKNSSWKAEKKSE